MAAVVNNATHYPIASLYVGDLEPEVTEAMLFEKFSAIGQVLSIRVCRDIITRHSLGYAYVNYQNAPDAERAIDTLNFEKLAGRPIRIMWSQRDPSLRRSGVGNIFIKNLDKDVDNKTLFDTFSIFGNILSCKVSFDDKSVSKGYGFVHFDTEESANNAITNLNNKFINDKKVFVGKFLARRERDNKGGPSRRFTNVYVKNLGEEFDSDEKLVELFKPFGSISSAVVSKDSEGKSKGFGFVCFEEAEDAERAVQQLNQKELPGGKSLFVGRAQKKAEREAEMKRRSEQAKAEQRNRTQGVNLYVKNLEDTINDERLTQSFAAYGTITSAKVMCDDKGRSKGFGFVCFSTPEEATKAVTEMNNKIIVSKPLYVALAQRKEDREAQKLSMRYTTGRNPLPQQMAPQIQGQWTAAGFGNGIPNMHGQQPGYLLPIANQVRGFYPGNLPTQPVGGPQVGAIRGPRNWANAGQHMPRNQLQYQPGGYRGANPRAANIRPVMAGGPQPPQMLQQGGPRAFGGAQRGPNPHQRGPVQGGRPKMVGQVPQVGAGGMPQQYGGEQLKPVNPEEQIQQLGEQLFNRIYKVNEGLAGKITGMLLEMGQTEIFSLLQDEEALRSKIDEAVDVLNKHTQQDPAVVAE